MKIKVSEATGVKLDWMVAKCEGGYDLQLRSTYGAKTAWQYTMMDEEEPERMDKFYLSDTSYSTDWQLGGPIIERERIELCSYSNDGVDTAFRSKGDEQGNYSHEEEYVISVPEVITWTAWVKYGSHKQDGPTPLIAAMRCFVCSRLGEIVEVPDELA